MTTSSEFLSGTVCCICEMDDSSPFLTVGGKSLVRCRACRLIYTTDFQSNETMYAGDGYFNGPGGYIERQDIFQSIFDPLVERIRLFKPTGALLDVGTGVGTFMEVAIAKGFDVKGIEVSKWASAYAREERALDVVTGTLYEGCFADASFDVVVLNHVLEHVEAPKLLLAEIRRILKDDGILAIGVPNAGGLMATIIGARWASWRPEQHIWHFTPDTLAALLRTVGFDVLHSEAKDNSLVTEFNAKSLAQRVINMIASLANRAETMMFILQKSR